jgi:putative sterol carrier protein
MEKHRRHIMAMFGSAEWLQLYEQSLNNSKSYEEAAKNWEGDFYFILEQGGTQKEIIYYYLDLWHGKCRKSHVAKTESEMKPEFIIAAPVSNWKKVIQKNLDPIQGLITRQLHLSGNMTKLLRSVEAAKELVNATTTIVTEFPA